MTDREALEQIARAAHSYAWGSCEELALPAILTFVDAHLAGDPDADRYARAVTQNASLAPDEYEFMRQFELRYGN